MLTIEKQKCFCVWGENELYNIEPIIKDTRGMLAFKRFNKTIVSKYKLYPIAVKKKRKESSLGYICYSYRLLENIIQSICNLHMHSFK